MRTLEFKPITKNPLHLLIPKDKPGGKLTFPDEIVNQVEKTWNSKEENSYFNDIRPVVSKVEEIDGREVYLMSQVPFKYLYAWNMHNETREREPYLPGLGPFTMANPLGKIMLPPSTEHPNGQTVLAKMAESGQLTALGGYQDVADFTNCTLPNDQAPIVPYLENGQIDWLKIDKMVKALEECEQSRECPDTPGIRCLLREGYEESGIRAKTLFPYGKWEVVETSPFGSKQVLEHWPVYDLYPIHEKTANEVKASFHSYDQGLKKTGGEREIEKLIIFENTREELLKKLQEEFPKRPSVDPVIKAELNRQYEFDRLLRLWSLIGNVDQGKYHQSSSLGHPQSERLF